MVVTNRHVRCHTIEDVIRALETVSEEEGKICLRDMGIVDEKTYKEYMSGLEKTIKEEEEKIKKLRIATESLYDKQEHSIYAIAVSALVAPIGYVGLEFLKYGTNTESIVVGLPLLAVGLLAVPYAFKKMVDYLKAENDLIKLKEERRKLEEDLNKNKRLYGLLLKYSNHFLGRY